jgi:hypothetical protein
MLPGNMHSWIHEDHYYLVFISPTSLKLIPRTKLRFTGYAPCVRKQLSDARFSSEFNSCFFSQVILCIFITLSQKCSTSPYPEPAEYRLDHHIIASKAHLSIFLHYV